LYLPFKGKLSSAQLQVIASRVKLSRVASNNSRPFFESQGKKSADTEFNLYLNLSKRFLKPYRVVKPKVSISLKQTLAPSVRSKKPLTNYKFCFKNYTVSVNPSLNSKANYQQAFFSKKNQTPQTSQLYNLFDINFLLKEMHYSKLKYSKTAERDIVSSGSAAIFAGFIGFLISEKFGVELVDSGDFILFLCIVSFSAFLLRYL